MGPRMRALLTARCAGETLGLSLDDAAGPVGLLLVTGGTQVRIGSHRSFERLSAGLAAAGFPCLRFDRRGVGDSSGDDPGWRGSGPDIAAAADAFRRLRPELSRIVGLGLCDGATGLALWGRAAALDGLVLVNPWLVEAEPGIPAPAFIRRHYRAQLTSLGGWRKILSGSVSYREVLRGVRRIVMPARSTLSREVAAALRAAGTPLELILSRRDATAVAAEHELDRAGLRPLLRHPPQTLDTDSHTFAREGDQAALLAAVQAALRRL